MLAFITQNLGTILVLLVVAVLVGLAAYIVIRDKKAGKCACSGSCGSCSGSCSGCNAAGLCHPPEKQAK